jgi:hypothetical protein
MELINDDKLRSTDLKNGFDVNKERLHRIPKMTTPDHILSAADIAKLRAAGFAVVPHNATAAIVDAGGDKLDNGASLYAAYRAMVAAAEAELIHAHTTQALEHLARDDAPACKGSLLLGSACQCCPKCIREREEIADKLTRLQRIEGGSTVDAALVAEIEDLKRVAADRERRFSRFREETLYLANSLLTAARAAS